MKNRFMLAPLTNCQSHDDGTLSDDEFRWLSLRAQGGFGLTMTCASHVQARGRGFAGQLGVFDDRHLDGLSRLAAAIRATGSLAMMQLHHAGMRAPAELIGGTPVCPSENAETGARALTDAEVAQLADDFVAAAVRAERAGFDGVEIHGAHGYVISQFLSPEINQRTDRYGGSPENRARLLFDIVAGIRARCRADFVLGVRLSPERFGLRLAEIRAVAQRLMAGGAIDLASLAEAFSQAVELFNSSNEAMIEHLGKVEQSLDRSSARSDEQMAYYVAQAREIIDQSMLSQKDIMEDLRSLNRKERRLATEAG